MPQAHSAAEISLAGRRMAHIRWSRTSDRAAATKPARDGLRRRFEREVDPDGLLPPDELDRRVESARRAFYCDMAARSIAARRARKAAGEER